MRNLIRRRPLSPDELRRHAELALERGDRAGALAALETAVRAAPEDSTNHLRLGRLLLSFGSPEAARQAFSAATVLQPTCAEAKRALADIPPRPEQPIEFEVGDVIHAGTHRYHVTGVRVGGFSVVYLADLEEAGNRSKVALKTFRGQTGWNRHDRERLSHEATAWLRLPPHPNVTTALMFEMIDDVPYLLLEQAADGDLASLLAQGALAPATCIDYGAQICDAMTFLSRHGVRAHGDLTPANCLIRDEDQIMLTDFGAAAAVREAEVLRGELGTLNPATARRYVTRPATAHYLPPEWRDSGRRTMRGDLYSFGVLLFVMLGGRPEDAARATRNDKAAPTALPARLADLIRRCTEPSPRRRPSSFRAVRGELAAIRRDFPKSRPTRNAAPRRPNPPDLPEGIKPASREARAALLKLRATSLLWLGRYRRCYRMLNAALRLDGSDAGTWSLKAILLSTLGDRQGALEAAEKASALAAGDPQAELAVAAAFFAAGDRARASDVLASAMASPDHAHSAAALACVAAADAGRWNECLTWVDRALARDRNYRLLTLKALAQYFHGDRDAALGTAAEVIRHRPLIRLAWVVRCLVHLARHDIQEAEVSYARVRDLSPVLSASTWALRGRFAAEHHRYDEAGRSVLEARATLTEAESVDRHVAGAVLADGAWAEHALEQSRNVADLAARALSLARSGPPAHYRSLALIAEASELDPTSKHITDCIWLLIHTLGGLSKATDLARTHYSGPELDRIVQVLTDRVWTAQSASAT
ncbi:protein kinase domain-containing protein [Actinomadura bangladeshensis]|uniref:non-specific serine/threonine protein kinase n=1 Tax=Actinomadura bangladeshensis TaxID=453573 RepID=A0A4R4NUQ6_9ACTN|nr:protein kinase [Actinomadura bangladeshensis]TDC11737.1 tetratricopeptide repeat protein [Actinomadura bangladeshensis]